MILYLISVVFGSIILLSLVILILIEDHKAKGKIKHSIPNDDFVRQNWKDRFTRFLDLLTPPAQFYQFATVGKVIWSGIQLTDHQFVSLWWILSLIGILGGILLFMFFPINSIAGLLIIVIIFLLDLAPGLYLRDRIRFRKNAVERSLPDYLDMLTLHLEAGVGFLPALRSINRVAAGDLRDEVGRALIQMELGFSKREALEELTRRLPSPDLAHVVEAILLSERLGTSLARTIRVQANLMRTHRRQRAEAKARTAPVRIIPALVFFFLPGLLLIYLAPPIINLLVH